MSTDFQQSGSPPDTTLPSVSIVILSYNALSVVQTCLPSVARTDYPDLEIVFADNASTDGTAVWVAEHVPEARVIRHPENHLFCKGNNEGVRAARGEYVVLLNNDVEVDSGWLKPLINRLLSSPDLGAVQPKLHQHIERDTFEYAGGAGGHIDRFGYPFTRGRLFFTMEKDTGQYDDEREIFWATGAALAMRRDLYLEMGGLDERFQMHMEEIDLCWRLHRAGYRIECVPESSVYHIGGASLPQGSPRKTYYNYRNNILALFKNLPRRFWLRTFACRLLLDGVGMLRLLFLGKLGEMAAVFQAYLDAHRMRREMEADRPSPDEPEILPSYRKSVVIDYFLLKKSRFLQLDPKAFLLPSGNPYLRRSTERSKD